MILVAGAGVYFLYRRGRRIREIEESQKNIKHNNEVVHRFGEFIPKNANWSPLDIYDQTELPYPKGKIIHALLRSIPRAGDDAKLAAALEHALLVVAQYQPGVGDPLLDPAAVITRNAAQIAATSAEAMTEAEREQTQMLAQQLTELTKQQEGRRKRFTPMVNEEMRRLHKLILRYRPR
jgi:hypothetical protein